MYIEKEVEVECQKCKKLNHKFSSWFIYNILNHQFIYVSKEESNSGKRHSVCSFCVLPSRWTSLCTMMASSNAPSNLSTMLCLNSCFSLPLCTFFGSLKILLLHPLTVLLYFLYMWRISSVLRSFQKMAGNFKFMLVQFLPFVFENQRIFYSEILAFYTFFRYFLWVFSLHESM